MEITCENLRRIVQGFSLVQACDIVGNDMLRIATPFKYPNGSQIDLFLRRAAPLFPSYILSDYGQTADYLADMQIKLWATKKRRLLLEDICSSLEVEQNAGQLEILLEENALTELSDAIVRLAQACIRVTDLAFTQRLQLAGTFQEEVEEYIASTNLPYEPEITLIGVYGKEVKVDFRVQGKKVTSLVQTLSTVSPANAHVASIEVFRRWYDLAPHRALNQFITLYDTTTRIFRDDDINRLSDLSLLLGFPDEAERFKEAIAA